ncbi:conserved hypothetical protein [Hydrogenimonas sp.]|nr:conserved hypothetical protein [Hydrogenimonas sp.]
MKKGILAVLFATVLLFAGCSNKVEEKATVTVKEGSVAPAIQIGKEFGAKKLTDQFDKEGEIGPDTKKVIMAFSKATGHLVKEFLATQPKDYLASKSAVFIADVSGMPKVIYEYMALPGLQKNDFPIYLLRNEKEAEKFKNEKYADYVMVIDLSDGIVEKVEFVTTVEELEKSLG